MLKAGGLAAITGTIVLAAACASSGAGGREVAITQRADGCTPASVQVTPGEKLKLVVKNDSGKDYEIEGIEGAKLEEVVVPEGRTRTPGYTVPDAPGVYKLKCYVPGGVSTIIELRAGGAGTPQSGASGNAPAAASPTAAVQQRADTTVAVTLADYSITPDTSTVAAGTVRFIATNTSNDVAHELAVLRVKDDGSLDNLGEIEPTDPGEGGTLTLTLQPGAYQLACLIAKGEHDSSVDHYQQGMHTAFRVD